MNTTLIELFNNGYDFAKHNADGSYVGVEWPSEATHHLNPTWWDTEANKTPSERWRAPVPGNARAVCAVPIKHVYRAAKIKVRRSLPKCVAKWPPYRIEFSEKSKRMVLLQYASLCGVFRQFHAKIKKMESKACDAFLKDIVKASRYFRSKQKADPETKAYWEKRKEQLAKQAPKKKAKKAGGLAEKQIEMPRSKSLAFSLEGKFEEQHKQAARAYYQAVVAFKGYPDKKHAREKVAAERAFILAVPVLKDRMQLGVIIRKEEGALGTTYTS